MIIQQKIGQEWMIYNPQDEQTHILNTTAGMIYEWSLQGHSPQKMEILLREIFHIPPEQNIADDIEECLGLLRQKKLIPQESGK